MLIKTPSINPSCSSSNFFEPKTMEPYTDFLGEAVQRDLEEEKKKKETLDDQRHQETSAMVPAPMPVPTTVDYLQFFTKETRRPRTNRKILGTMKVTKEGPSYDMKKDSDEVVHGEPMSHEEVLRREKLLKRPMEVESTSDDDDERVLGYFDFFDNCAQGKCRNRIVIREVKNNQPEELPRNLSKRKMENNCSVDQEIKKAKAGKVLDLHVHRRPRVKIVETRKLLLDLNHPPPEETQEKEQKKKLKNKKRKADSDDGRIKKKKSRFREAVNKVPNPPPELPQKVMDRIRRRAEARGRVNVDDGEVILVIQKTLTASDLKGDQNRFIYTEKQLTNKFLTEEEKEHIEGRDKKNRHRIIKVPIIEPSKKVKLVNFTRWIRGKNSESYVLNGTWNTVVEKNNLVEGQVVQLWAFRINGELHFAFVVLPSEAQKNIPNAARSGQGKGVDIVSTSKAAAPISPDDRAEGASDEQMASTSKAAASPTNPDGNEDGSDYGDQCTLASISAAAGAPSSPPENDEGQRNTSSTANQGTHSSEEDKETSTSDMLRLQFAPRMDDE